MTNKKGRLILINGSSSAGKTSVSKKLQLMLGMDCLYLSMDKFLGMLSTEACNLEAHLPNFLQPHEGLYAVRKSDGSFDIAAGPLAKKLLHEMYDIVQYFLDHGWQVIFDTVETNLETMHEIKVKFAKYHAYYVYLYANHETLRSRERIRGNRLIGQTINILERFASRDLHDLHVDTSDLTPQAIAELINKNVSLESCIMWDSSCY